MVLEKIKGMFHFIESKKRSKYLITVRQTKPRHGNEIKINNVTSLIIHGNNAYLYWKNSTAFPALYRALYIFSQYVHLKNESLLIHGAGLKKDNSGYIFAGPSGSGKTTLAKKVSIKNLVNDEVVAVKKIKNNFYLQNTPFGSYYSNSRNIIKIKAIILLRHARKISIRKINYPYSVSMLLPHISFLHCFKHQLRINAFQQVSELCKKIRMFNAGLTLKTDIKKLFQKLLK